MSYAVRQVPRDGVTSHVAAVDPTALVRALGSLDRQVDAST